VPKPDFKSIFIVDPVKGDRLQLAKLLKQEKLFMMTFVSLVDCFKQNNPIKPDLVIYVLRKGKTELTHLKNIKNHLRSLHFIIVLTSDIFEANLDELKDNGFTSVHKAGSQDMVKEHIYTLLPEAQMTQEEETPEQEAPAQIK
jgi:DNA-binding NtrC family response regulator